MASLIGHVRRQWAEILREDSSALAMMAQQARDASSLLEAGSGPESAVNGMAETRLRALRRGCRIAQRQPAKIGDESS